MENLSRGLLFITMLTGMACTSLNTSKSPKEKSYSEDVTSYLPSDVSDTLTTAGDVQEQITAADSTLDITPRLDSALFVVDSFNNENKTFIEGLSLQLYAGNDRSEAKEIQMKAFRYFPESNPKIIFDQPNYKVRMGSFYTQLEAYPIFRSVQERFPKAILVPIRIPVSGN